MDGAENVQIKISGTYENTLDICFYLTLFQNGILETAYEVQKLFRHMPHRVKAEIGISSGGLGEKGGAYYVTEQISRLLPIHFPSKNPAVFKNGPPFISTFFPCFCISPASFNRHFFLEKI